MDGNAGGHNNFCGSRTVFFALALVDCSRGTSREKQWLSIALQCYKPDAGLWVQGLCKELLTILSSKSQPGKLDHPLQFLNKRTHSFSPLSTLQATPHPFNKILACLPPSVSLFPLAITCRTVEPEDSISFCVIPWKLP